MAGETWPRVRLETIAATDRKGFAMGPFGSNIKSENYQPSGVPVLRGVNLGDGAFSGGDLVFLSEEKAEELKNSQAFPDDLVFVAQGTVGRVALVPNIPRFQKTVLSQNLMKFSCDSAKADSRFLYYFFISSDGQQTIRSRVNPTGVPCISRPLSSLKEFEVTLPPLAEQKAIAAVLGALDDKIELNRRMNATLEAMARALFQSWFVDAAADGLPKGWRVGTIGDVAENARRGINPDQMKPASAYIGLEHMPRRSIALSEWGHAGKLESNKFEFRRGEILFGKLRAYFHKVGVAPVDGVCSTDILVVRPKKPEWFGFVLGHVSSVELVSHTDAASTGTKMPRTNWNDIARFEAALPPESLAAKFTELIRPMIDRMIANIHQSRTLATLRDTLLPKLLSGELSVAAVGGEEAA